MHNVHEQHTTAQVSFIQPPEKCVSTVLQSGCLPIQRYEAKWFVLRLEQWDEKHRECAVFCLGRFLCVSVLWDPAAGGQWLLLSPLSLYWTCSLRRWSAHSGLKELNLNEWEKYSIHIRCIRVSIPNQYIYPKRSSSSPLVDFMEKVRFTWFWTFVYFIYYLRIERLPSPFPTKEMRQFTTCIFTINQTYNHIHFLLNNTPGCPHLFVNKWNTVKSLTLNIKGDLGCI